MTSLPLLALLAVQPPDSAAEPRVVLGAESTRAWRSVAGILVVSSADTAPASVRLASAAPARFWWRTDPVQSCPDTPPGEPILTARPRLSGDDAFYFCVRPEADAALRVVATVRVGARTSVAVGELPRASRGGLSAGWLAALTAVFGLVSGIVVNYYTSRNQLRSDLAKRQQELDAAERDKRITVVTAVQTSLVAEIQRALRDLRDYAASPSAQAESAPQLKLGGMQVVMDTKLLREFLESAEQSADFERLKRIFQELGAFNKRARNEADPTRRRALALQAANNVEAIRPA